jgi:hypothetical protein
VGAWHYRPVSTQIGERPLSPARVGVVPFEDRRPERNSDLRLLYLIPLYPIGTFEYDRIEKGASFLSHSAYQIRPPEDLAKAVLAEVEAANLFAEAFYTEREHEPGVQYLLRGVVDEFHYDGKIISYGLSAYGPILWVLGLPAGTTTNSLRVGLELLRASDGEVLWRSEPFSAEKGLTTGLYYNWGREFDAYPQMMGDADRAWIGELADFIRGHPALFQQ